jgi:hypothetical protein
MSARSPLVKSLQCIACQKEGCEQLQSTEEHHLNVGGKAGQKRRGNEYSIPLCGHHHRGEPPEGMTATDAYVILGPSLARNSVQFRCEYGSDDALLAETNEQLRSVA